ncbi:MAG: DNA alkylation repair protein, partial [Hominenteromicrobium sp.]
SFSLNRDSALPMLGVRLPVLRKMAAKIAREDARGFLGACDFSSIEMTMLYAYVLGRARGEIGELLAYFDRAVPHIDNWSNCDTLCQSFKQAEQYPAETWDFLMRYRTSEEPFTLRVLVVTLMCHFLTDDYIDRVLDILNTTRCGAYYYKMGAAWAVATAMAKYRDKTLAFLNTCSLDDWTYNKAIQKMLESYRVSDADKALLRTMKRKGARTR